MLRVVVVALEDLVQRRECPPARSGVNAGSATGAAGAAERRLLAPLAVRLGRAPVDVEAALGVDAAHVDALDGAGLRALEARLALERAVLVVQELEPAAELGRDVGRLTSGYRIVALGSKNRVSVRAMPFTMPMPGTRLMRVTRCRTTTIAAAVTNRLRSDAGSSHFQAKPISWSIRTRGSVPRIHTNTNTNRNVLTRNQTSPATQSSSM